MLLGLGCSEGGSAERRWCLEQQQLLPSAGLCSCPGCSGFPEANSSRRIQPRDCWDSLSWTGSLLQPWPCTDTPSATPCPRAVPRHSSGTCPVPGPAPARAVFASPHPRQLTLLSREQNHSAFQGILDENSSNSASPRARDAFPGAGFGPKQVQQYFSFGRISRAHLPSVPEALFLLVAL